VKLFECRREKPKMQVEYVPIDSIKPYEKNAKKHPDEQVEHIANSIKEFGFRQPLVIDKDNVVVIGHGRLLAAKKLGIAEVPVLRADDLTEAQINALRLADNKTNEPEWDFSMLEAELDDLRLDFDMSDFGFDMSDEDLHSGEVQEDEVPEPPAEPRSKIGDLYQLGEHRLICGDSTDVAVIDRLMDGVKADCVFTDPPYGYNYQSNWRTKSEKFEILENDDKTLNFFCSIKNSIDGFVYVCTTWKVADKWIELFKKYYDLTNVIIWDKGGGGIGDLFHTFSTDYEMILVSNNGHELRGKRYGSVWNFTNTEISKMKKDELLKIVLEQKEYYSIWKQRKDNPNEYVHPTQKPVALSARAIRSSTDFENIVLDLFGGSGSTLIACEQLNRKCYMAELDEHYCDVILQRYINFKGSDADVFLLKDGKKIPYSEAYS
jgi:DNA modification methylase